MSKVEEFRKRVEAAMGVSAAIGESSASDQKTPITPIGKSPVEHHVTEMHGHPWNSKGDWDLLEARSLSEADLAEFIARAEREHWHVWLRADEGQGYVAMYRPRGIDTAWTDDHKGGYALADKGAVRPCDGADGKRPETGHPVDWKAVAEELYGAVDSLETQVEQMKGLFSDDDGLIQEALDEAHGATKLYLSASTSSRAAELKPQEIERTDASRRVPPQPGI
ncbi:hypothetical protein [Trinickia sp. EG282A]|uniref:hypothetical protein n=1 Tax=Trinickia sp. EG282A TaxID=3237013 RepID=UPI0034D1F81F